MKKKMSEKEWEKFLEQEYIEEADRMEQALRSDDSEDIPELSGEEIEASYARLVERLKQEGRYREDARGDSAEASGKIRRFSGRSFHVPVRRAARIAGILLVCALGVFAAGMTSEANRKYFIDRIQYLVGDDAHIVIQNDKEIEDVKVDEYAAIAAIEKELGVKVPEFFYVPDGFVFYNYEIDTYSDIARMEYLCNDAVVVMLIDRKDETVASDNISLHGEEITKLEVQVTEELLNVQILEVQDDQDVKPAYVAQWTMDDVFYQVQGKLDKKEFIKMIENMKI